MRTRAHAAVILMAMAIVVAACGDDSGGSTTTSAATTTSATTTTTSTTTSATTTSTLPPVIAGELGVALVDKSDPDWLMVQPTPAVSVTPLATAPPNGVGLFATSQAATDGDGATWYEVDYPLAGVTGGWVPAEFVVPVPSFGDVPCSTDPADYGVDAGSITPATPPAPVPGGPVATVVYALHHMSDPNCERTVVTFGTDLGGGTYGTADNLPPLGGASTPLPGAFPGLLSLDFTTDVPMALPSALELWAWHTPGNGVVNAFVTRHNAGSPTISLDLQFANNRAVHVYWVTSPLQLVIDTVDAPTGTGLDLQALVADLAAIDHPINWDLNGPSPVPPIKVTGWARPFEATLQVRLRQAPAPGALLGSGALAPADWSGTLGGAPVAYSGESSVIFDTTDWTEVWGWFEFTIDQLAAGDYELFIGDLNGEDGSESGVYEPFTVGP